MRPTDHLAAAIEIGEILVAEAVPADGGATWIGDDLMGTDEQDSTVIRGPLGADLYGGTAGIAWFLGHLARVTRSQAFADAARAGLGFALSAAKSGQCGLSLYSGATGVALAAVEVAYSLDDASLRDEGLELGRAAAGATGAGAEVEATDLLGGLAGLGLGFIALHRLSGERLFLDASVTACRRLVERRSAAWWGSSWPEHEGQPALCGLGHGVSGMGLALAETAWASGDASLLDRAHEAFRYERSWFSPDHCAWPDLRQAEAPAWTTAWCHGALGIGAVRLRCFEATGEDWALAEATAALQAARALAIRAGRDVAQGVAHDVTLCHGLGGVVELILLAAEILKAPEHGQAARRVADLCLSIRALNQGRWTNGLRGCDHVPGLFAGLAGIGVTMMRVNDPASIGSPMLAGRPRPT